MKAMKIYFLTAIIALSSALSISAQEAIEYEKKGIEAGRSGDLESAVKNFDMAIDKYDRASAKSFHNMGWLHEQKGDVDGAIKFYEEAVRRNPDQQHSYERVGQLYFDKKIYDKAIIAGERVLKLDPLNEEVMKWLPEAYAEYFKLRQRMIEKKIVEKEKEKVVEAVKQEKAEEKKYRKVFTISYDVLVRSAYKFEGKNDFAYEPTDALGPDMPNTLKMELRPTDNWGFKLMTGRPYQGALMPEFLAWKEKFEFMHYSDSYYIGGGVMGNHYSSSEDFGEKKEMSDYKLGFVFGKMGERSKLDISFYPRLFPYDAGYTGNKTFDVDSLDVDYRYSLAKGVKLYGAMSINDYYVFDHSIPASNYYGNYDFTFGFSVNDEPGSKFIFSMDLTERLYQRNLYNDKPYKFLNGQGWFGIDAYHWFKGEPLSGFYTTGHVLSFNFEERLGEYFFMYQKLSAELVTSTHKEDDFCLLLGVGGNF